MPRLVTPAPLDVELDLDRGPGRLAVDVELDLDPGVHRPLDRDLDLGGDVRGEGGPELDLDRR